MMKTIICFFVAAAMVACTFPPQKQPEVAQTAPERPIEPEPVLPVVEVKAKPIKAKPITSVSPASPTPLPVPPNPCLGIEAEELKVEISEKLTCLEETLK